MRLIWKIVFVIYNLFLIVLGGSVATLALGYGDFFGWFSAAAQYSKANRMTALTMGIALIILALLMILLACHRKKKKLLVVKTENGQRVTISLKAAQNMVLQSLLGIQGIREVTPEILSSGRGIRVRLHITAEARNNMPALCEEMKQRIEEHLGRVSGLKVLEVTVLVENIVPMTRNRVLPAKAEGAAPAKTAEKKKSLFSSRKKAAEDVNSTEEAPKENAADAVTEKAEEKPEIGNEKPSTEA